MIQKIHLIAGARPNFMKIAPLYHALSKEDWLKAEIVHTGQHYDEKMSNSFFKNLALPKPKYNLNVGSGRHAEQTAKIMIEYEKLCEENRPDWIIVVGDVNSTLACSIVAAKLLIPIAHLEAGLRSYDREMPEEVNRVLTDQVCDLLWTPSMDGNENLIKEGVSKEKIDFVGNIMLDSFEMLRDEISCDDTRVKLGLEKENYCVLTLHRPSNVDDKIQLEEIITEVILASEKIKIVFPIHPRTLGALEKFELLGKLKNIDSIVLSEPLSYIKFMNLVLTSKAVLTDSGGIQEETTYIGIPCFTLRDNTERPITVTEGTNQLIKANEIRKCIDGVLNLKCKLEGTAPTFWDGKTAARVVESLKNRIFSISNES